jgi:3'-phosphoadenosine 5'-phosphosulfate sulfotransferase (PAPS reductase)/FAD synthetase
MARRPRSFEKEQGMKLVSYSGGLGSFMAAYLVRADKPKLIFTDTKTEDEDLYRFLDETAKALDLELITIADGRDIWGVFNHHKYMGNNRGDLCSQYLKRVPFRKFVEKNFNENEDTIVFGIDHKEAHRMESINRNWAPWKTEAPLCTTHVSREEILDVLEDMGIAPPRLYEMGFPHNNCGGFCVKTGQKQMKMLLDKMPERYRLHEEQQEKLFERMGKRHGFIRKVVNGEMHYMGLKEFREMIERGEKAEMWNQEGCGCFV